MYILPFEFLGGTPFADPSQSKIFEKIVKSKDYLKFPKVGTLNILMYPSPTPPPPNIILPIFRTWIQMLKI
jgi:hypothetical protein